jgi:hypothetical protein
MNFNIYVIQEGQEKTIDTCHAPSKEKAIAEIRSRANILSMFSKYCSLIRRNINKQQLYARQIR